MDWIMEFLLGLLTVATGILTILQINANTRQKVQDAKLAQYANEKQELQNELSNINANAEVLKSLIEVNGKMSANMEKLGDKLDKNTDALYINTQLANEKIGKLGDTVGQSITEQKKTVEGLSKLDKSISQAQFDTSSQIEKLGLDIRTLIEGFNSKLNTIEQLTRDKQEKEYQALKDIAKQFKQDIDSLLPSLKNIIEDCKGNDKPQDENSEPDIKVVPKDKNDDKEQSEDIA